MFCTESFPIPESQCPRHQVKLGYGRLVLRVSFQPSFCPLRSTQTPSERPLWDVSLRVPSCLEAFQDPQFQGLFRHLLRTKASGSTERWGSMPETGLYLLSPRR